MAVNTARATAHMLSKPTAKRDKGIGVGLQKTQHHLHISIRIVPAFCSYGVYPSDEQTTISKRHYDPFLAPLQANDSFKVISFR